jgi:glycosylphosphatidylinositol phospholipase D
VFVVDVDAVDLDDAAVLLGVEGDRAGAALATVGDTDGDGLGDLVVGCPGAGENAGAVVWLAGPVVDLASGVRHEGSAGDALGTTVAGLGDVDGDGRADWGVGAPYVDAANTGAVWIVTTAGALDAQARLSGAGPFDYAGVGLAGPGDIDGDGLADVAVAASGVDDGGADAGAVFVAWGPFVGTRGVEEGAVRLDARAHEQVSVIAPGGDLDGDAVPDLLVGVWRADDASGAVYLVGGAGL